MNGGIEQLIVCNASVSVDGSYDTTPVGALKLATIYDFPDFRIAVAPFYEQMEGCVDASPCKTNFPVNGTIPADTTTVGYQATLMEGTGMVGMEAQDTHYDGLGGGGEIIHDGRCRKFTSNLPC